MSEPITISPAEPTNKGLDYASLKEEGTLLIQRLAGKIWTDYNEHDPGVTTLEQLCYALTELSYRAEFPLQDLLIDKKGGRINPRRQALFIPRRILPCNPLTENDYRKLLIDRVPQVANVWLTPHRSHETHAHHVNGLYDIALYVPNADPCVCDGDEYNPEEIRRRVRRVYCRHRNLCEDVHSIRILKPVRVVVNAHVVIDNTLAAEAILAGILFNLGNFLAPEPRRESLKSMLDRGLTPDEIFNGPLLRNGFIPDAQLQPKATSVNVQQIIRVMVRTKGVRSVSGVTVQAGDNGTTYSGDASIPVTRNEILQLFTRPESKLGGFSIKLFKNGIEYRPNAARVARELEKLWANARRTYRLMPQYEEFFALPKGQYHQLEQYYSIQNQYPNVYGINAYGLPAEAPPVRRAQAKQLKGYLLVFEQLLADYFAQLAHAKDLYSTERHLEETYFFQYLTESVPDVEPLLKEDYRSGLYDIIRSQDQVIVRRNRFLDFLLALYAEKLDQSEVFDLSHPERPEDDSGERLMRAKLALLHHLVTSTHNRGRGFDYLAPASAHNIAGMEIKSRIQLGMDAFDHRPLMDVLDEHALEIAESRAEASLGRTLDRHAEYIEENFIPVTSAAPERERADESLERPAQLSMTLRGQTMTEEFLDAALEIENFRVGSLPGDAAVALVCKSPSEDEWRLVWKYTDRETAVASAHALVEQVRHLKRHCRQLYIVEHTLLRFGRSKPYDDYSATTTAASADVSAERDARIESDDEKRCLQAPLDERQDPPDEHDNHWRFIYSFTITAVVSAPARPQSDDDYQAIVRDVIRQNTPSHIAVDYCFLRPVQMRRFESLYWAWRRALRRRNRREIIFTSAELRRFLRQCRRREDRPVDKRSIVDERPINGRSINDAKEDA